MAKEPKARPEQKDSNLKDLTPKQDQDVVGGREPTKHPAKVTVPDLKF
jgi:hypothetical protein